ncbi:hypothetical protein JF50_20250 [Pseudoalteromonas luteoviolacea]|uniref:Uncharacterized protein n=1 Tax=Pseudoalteromonas luteoviolacea TaxID=43657 RepID=A0A0C1Q7Q3_9GAMM|nr:hypothetical protein [Pseudoalteromonas luteoviolacea]KID55540.1 hypothetical protein JF50_20250 [Pseudoalteromonas luteoviolacea]
MKHRDNNNILQNEFAFRYLYPKEDIETPWPMDEWEQSVVHQVQTGTQDEVCAHFDGLVDNLLCNQINAESPLDQLCLFVYLLSTNLSITPSMAFMRHRTYPSPRSYYPFISQFYYGGSLYEFSEREMSIVRIGEHGAGCGVILKPRFDSYNEIYNLFRKSLLSLELGHLTKQAYELANLLGLQIENRSASALFTFALNVVNEPKLELLHRYMRKARARNSGEYSWVISLNMQVWTMTSKRCHFTGTRPLLKYQRALMISRSKTWLCMLG